ARRARRGGELGRDTSYGLDNDLRGRVVVLFFFSSRRRHTRSDRDWSSDVCSSDLGSEMIKEVWVDRATWNDLPWRLEPGTPPIAETVGLTAAIEYLEKLGMERVREHEQALATQAVEVLSAIPGVRVYGPRRERAAVVAFAVDGWHPHDVAAALDAEGIAVRAGHHCAQPLMRWCGVVATSRARFSVYHSSEEVALLSPA